MIPGEGVVVSEGSFEPEDGYTYLFFIRGSNLIVEGVAVGWS
jgi:hypothetical protein